MNRFITPRCSIHQDRGKFKLSAADNEPLGNLSHTVKVVTSGTPLVISVRTTTKAVDAFSAETEAEEELIFASE